MPYNGYMLNLIMTDNHLGLKKGNHFWHSVAVKSFTSLCTYAKEHGIKRLIYLGDFFDDRKNLNIYTISIAQKIGKMLNKTFDDVIMLEGNHDQYYKHKAYPSSLEVLSKFKNIKILYEPETIGNILFLPWIFNTDILTDPKVPYCCGHFEIGGFVPGLEGGLSVGMFKKFDKVLSGHFHTRMANKNVYYMGDPYHMSFNDSGPRGFHTFDDDNGDLEFIPLTDLPKFVTLNHTDDYEKTDIEGNIIRLFFTKDLGTLETTRIVEGVKKCDPHQLFTKFQIDSGFTDDKLDEETEIELKSNRQLHIEYLEQSELPENIKETTLIKMVNNLWKEL